MGNGASVGLSGLIGEDDIVDDSEHPGDMVEHVPCHTSCVVRQVTLCDLPYDR